MSHRPRRLAWAPAFLVGASAAVAAEVAVAVLLYGGPGLVRSLTVILAVEGVAVAAGLWTAPTPGPDLVDRLRRRWLLSLAAFLAAAVYGVLWSLPGLVGDGRWSQGLGLALITGLPVYACGSVLGGLSAVAASGPEGSTRGPGAAAALGAGVGFVLTGLLLPRAPMPASLLVACLVMMSLGGMLFGVVLSSVLDVRVRARRPAKGGDVRVEERRVPAAGIAERVLLEGAHERACLDLGGDGAVGWDVAVARAVMPEPDRPWRVLAVGGGASNVGRSVVREHPTGTVDVLERTGAVVELGREHLGTELGVGVRDRVTVRVGNLEDLLASLSASYDLVLVDAAALAPIGGARGLSRTARERLSRAVGAGGVMAWGPTTPEPGLPEVVEGWAHAVFDRPVEGRAPEALVVSSPGPLDALPDSFEGFVSRNGGVPAT